MLVEPITPIESERLTLRSMTSEFLEASLAGDRVRAASLIGLTVPLEWFEEHGLINWRLNDLRREPDLQPWLLRAVGLRDEGRMIGHIGFHTQPDPPYLAQLAPGGIEFGYTIFPAFRRQGYAQEAAQALMDWAHQSQGITRFVVSISPENIPSLMLTEKLQFVRIGSHVDDEDGIEEIFELQRPAIEP